MDFRKIINRLQQLVSEGIITEDVAKKIYPNFVIESEDERIRKEIISALKFANDGGVYDKHIAYLEKQKEQKDYRKLYEDIAQSEWFKKAYAGKSLGEEFEQKEQNDESEECTDFTIYHPLKNAKGEYECIPYSFYGSLTSFSEDKDLIDFLRTCFYTEEECNEWIEKQKEQKPWRVGTNAYFTPEQKPADDKDFEDNTVNVEMVTDPKTGEKYPFVSYKDQLQKPAEWDEYTKTNLDRALQIIKKAKGTLQGYQSDDGIYECDKAIECLEHFLYRGLEIEKPGEWSEEDEK